VFQQSELVCLGLAVPLAVPIVLLARDVRLPGVRLLVAAAITALAAATFTVAEDLLWFPVFNALEHAGYAATGLLAAIGCRRLAAWSRSADDKEAAR
jgi:hypothetical protein